MHARVLISLVILASAMTTDLSVAASKPVRHYQTGSANFPDDSISIVTENSAPHQDDRIAELARAYAAAGLPRVLPVAGLGPISNARDLLQMRGIDFAVLDSDIRAFARLDGSMPGIETRLMQVLKLYDKTIYIVAASGIATLPDLSRKKVMVLGEDSDGYVTARTVFGLLGIAIDLAAADKMAAGAALADHTAKALVLVAGPGENPLANLPKDIGLHLIAAPASPALDKIYLRATLTGPETSGFAPASDVPVLRVAVVLATYNWHPNLYRYAAVQQFLAALPQAMAALRNGASAPFWRSVDAQSPAADWQPYSGATAALTAILPAVVESRVPDAAPPAPPLKSPAENPIAGGIELVLSPLPGLAGPEAPGGGLLAELTAASLPAEQLRLQWVNDASGAVAKIGNGTGARLGLASRRPDCSGSEPLSADDKRVCEGFVFSKPVFQALDVFFVRHGSEFTFERDDQVAGRSVCAATGADTTALDAPGRRWLSQELLTLLRRPTLADCFTALDRGEAEAVFADELAGKTAIEQSGLLARIEVVDRPVAVRDLSAFAAKSDPMAAELMSRLEAGLNRLKANGRYSEMVMSRLRGGLSAKPGLVLR